MCIRDSTSIGGHVLGAALPQRDFNGLIDDARIYTRALSADEIAAIATDQATSTDSVDITINPVNDAPAFSAGDGIVTHPIGTGADFGQSVAVQPDGKVLLAGYADNGGGIFDNALTRYNTDGSLDTTFGTNGIVVTSFGAGSDRGQAVALSLIHISEPTRPY